MDTSSITKERSKIDKWQNLGTFKTRAAAEKHEQEVRYFKRHYRNEIPNVTGFSYSNNCNLLPDFSVVK